MHHKTISLVSAFAAITSGTASAQTTRSISQPVRYENVFSAWRDCAAAHQHSGNPPPECEELRDALRQAMATRPRE